MKQSLEQLCLKPSARLDFNRSVLPSQECWNWSLDTKHWIFIFFQAACWQRYAKTHSEDCHMGATMCGGGIHYTSVRAEDGLPLPSQLFAEPLN